MYSSVYKCGGTGLQNNPTLVYLSVIFTHSGKTFGVEVTRTRHFDLGVQTRIHPKGVAPLLIKHSLSTKTRNTVSLILLPGTLVGH